MIEDEPREHPSARATWSWVVRASLIGATAAAIAFVMVDAVASGATGAALVAIAAAPLLAWLLAGATVPRAGVALGAALVGASASVIFAGRRSIVAPLVDVVPRHYLFADDAILIGGALAACGAYAGWIFGLTVLAERGPRVDAWLRRAAWLVFALASALVVLGAARGATHMTRESWFDALAEVRPVREGPVMRFDTDAQPLRVRGCTPLSDGAPDASARVNDADARAEARIRRDVAHDIYVLECRRDPSSPFRAIGTYPGAHATDDFAPERPTPAATFAPPTAWTTRALVTALFAALWIGMAGFVRADRLRAARDLLDAVHEGAGRVRFEDGRTVSVPAAASFDAGPIAVRLRGAVVEAGYRGAAEPSIEAEVVPGSRERILREAESRFTAALASASALAWLAAAPLGACWW